MGKRREKNCRKMRALMSLKTTGDKKKIKKQKIIGTAT